MAFELYETRREEIARDFFRSLKDFSNGGEYRQQGSTNPHLLREDYNYQDRYFGTMFSMAQELLKNAYEDSGAHQYTSLLAALISRDEEKKPASEWSKLFPEVAEIIYSRGPDARQAFETLFEICKIYQKSVEDTPSAHSGKRITPERHGLTQDQADRMHGALLKIWQAYPEADTRVNEGFDYAMNDPGARKTFTFPSPIGGTSGYIIGEHSSEDRSDYRLAEMLESYDGQTVTRLDVWKHKKKIQPEALAAIASQTIENFEKLQEFSVPIAENCLSGFLKLVCKKDNSDSEGAAKEILGKLVAGTTTIEQEAQKIRKGDYGSLAGGYRNWLQKDDERKRVLVLISGAKDYLSLCLDVYGGEWFGRERDKIAAFCAQKNLPGFVSRPVIAAPAPAFL